MTNILIGSPSPAPLPKGAERHVKSHDQNDGGFAEALDGKPSQRSKPKDEVGDDTHLSRLSSKLEDYLSGLEELASEVATTVAPDSAPVEDVPEVAETDLFVDDHASNIEVAAPDYVALDDLSEVELPIAGNENEPTTRQPIKVEPVADTTPPIADAPEVLSEKALPARAPEVNATNASLALQGQPRPAPEPQNLQSARNKRPDATLSQDRILVETRQGETPARAAAAVAPPADTGRFTPIAEALRPATQERQSRAGSPTPDPVASRVNVLGFTAAISPSTTTLPQLSSTSSGLVSAMEADPTWRSAALDGAAAAAQRGATSSGGVNTLKIQLHPIELGVVTAKLTATGTQLSVEVQVESSEAFKKLSTDSDAILKALRGIGYDVEKISIQQAPQTPSTAQQQPAGRDQSFANQQATGGDEAKGQGNQRGGSPQDSERSTHGSGETSADRAGSSLYI